MFVDDKLAKELKLSTIDSVRNVNKYVSDGIHKVAIISTYVNGDDLSFDCVSVGRGEEMRGAYCVIRGYKKSKLLGSILLSCDVNNLEKHNDLIGLCFTCKCAGGEIVDVIIEDTSDKKFQSVDTIASDIVSSRLSVRQSLELSAVREEILLEKEKKEGEK